VRLILLLLLLPGLAAAQSVTNGSFESNTIAAGTWNGTAPTGWKGNCATWKPVGYFATLPDGASIAWMNGGTCSQDFGVAPRINTTYTLTLSIGHRNDGHSSAYEIALTDAGASFCATSGDSSTIPLGAWITVTLPCPVGASQPTGNLGVLITSTGPSQLDFDNVTLTAKPTTPPQTVNFSFSGQVLINGAPATGTIGIYQLSSGASQQVANVTPDASGNISGTVALALSDIVSLNVYNYDGLAKLINQGSIMPFPGSFLANLHGISGFVLMLSCALPIDPINGNPIPGSVPICVTASGTNQGVLN